MKYLLAILFLVGSAHPLAYSQINVDEIFESLTTKVPLLIKYGFSGYNPFLTSEQVLNIYCAKPSDKVFNQVYFNDPQMGTKLDLTKPVGFLIHGWIDNGNSTWMKQLCAAWVENHDTNVCCVDWSIYSMVEYIVAAKRNAYLVAEHLANFIKCLHDGYGLNYADVTLIGHSLGGQICGITGYLLRGEPGRIIALDPAGPGFTFPTCVPLEDQLDKSDAKFVTVVHSNNYILGVGYSIGHADYYPNGGATIQPGCVFPILCPNYGFDIEPCTCSHFRANKFFELTLNNDPLCRAIKCNTSQDYFDRKCTGTTDTWGINSAKIEGEFYFWSGVCTPRCLNEYWPLVW